MPIYDFGCACGARILDRLSKLEEVVACPECASPMEHLWTATPTMINDSCDMVVENLASHPLYFDSKTKWRERMAQLGKINRVEHKSVPGSDRSPITTRWV